MAVIAPQTDLYLLKVPLEINDTNQLTFASQAAQFNYFNSLPKIQFDDFTYQRKDNTVRLPALYDDIINYNYVMYRNDAYSDKWFYAFIEQMEYVNDNVTVARIKNDVWQCWQFDLDYKTTFVEREHVNDDTIGLHTVPENLELGSPIINGTTSFAPSKIVVDSGNNPITREYLIVLQVSEMLENVYFTQDDHQYNRIYSGLHLIAVTSEEDANKIIRGYAFDETTGTDAIVSIFLAPKELFPGAYAGTFAVPSGSGTTTPVTIYAPKSNAYADVLLDPQTIAINTTLNGYTPRNNKLFTYPYNYLYLTNNAGEDIEFRYEDFVSHTPKFAMTGVIGQGCSIKLIPIDYKNNEEPYAYSLNGPKLPVCAWASDYYTNWVTQNAVNIGVNLASSVVSGGIGLLQGNAVSGLTALGQIANTVAEIETQKRIPDQAHGNTGASDINFASRRFFSALKMSVRSEYAEIIDDYFTMFGYKVNQVKVPNITGRRNWNYVKTIGCYIEGNIPQDDLNEIKLMFDKGITLWHNPATFADYNQNNDII